MVFALALGTATVAFWHQVPFLDLRLLLSRQPVEHLAEVPA
jgi:hypothetical protein